MKRYDTFDLGRTLSFDGGQTWWTVATSDDRVYLTHAAPSAAVLYESLLDIGCRNADGQSSVSSIVSAIWSDFQGPVPGVTRKAMDGHNVADGHAMTYWNNGSVTDEEQVLAGLLDSGNGSCIAWSQLLHQTVKAQGIDGSTIYELYYIDKNSYGFLVKDWRFGKSITAGADGTCDTTAAGDDDQAVQPGQSPGAGVPCVLPGPNGILDTTPAGDDREVDGVHVGAEWPYEKHKDAWDQSGVAGQGNSDPPPHFANHFIVKYGGQFYDPSYGNGPFDSEAEHEAASIDGMIRWSDDHCKKDPSGQQLTYTRRTWAE